jgi:lipoprotein-releasing system permease protein
MNPIQFISRRYLFSGKDVSLISVLTYLSITGVTIGTALLIIVLSVFNGFYDVIRGLLLAQDPDIRIEHAVDRTFQFDQVFMDEILETDGVVAITPFLAGKSMLAFRDDRNEVVSVRGIETDSFLRINDLEAHVRSGRFDFSVQNERPGIVLSESIRNRHRISIDDEIALLSASGMRRALTQFSAPRINRFKVRGTYSMQQIAEGDQVYIDLMAAQRLFNARNQITGFDLRLHDTDAAQSVKRNLEEKLGTDYKISTWYDLQKPLYDVMYLEKWGSYFILMIIVIVAVLNIVGSLTMIVIQKKRDIGILISMGMSKADIRNIFRSQGFYIGLIGCGLGGTIGLILTWMQHEYGLLKLSSAFIIDAYPVSVSVFDVGIVLFGSMFLCLAASWYPAIRAAQVNSADAVRYE